MTNDKFITIAYTGEVKNYPPPLPKHDMTVSELRQYDGTSEDGRICIAINRKIFDVSKGKCLTHVDLVAFLFRRFM